MSHFIPPRLICGLLTLFTFFTFLGPKGQALERAQVPALLEPWVDWALHDDEEALCPFLNGEDDSRECSWAGPLALSLTENGGTFSQAFTLYHSEWIPLPGEETRWPQSVEVNGKPTAVVPIDGKPHIFGSVGTHQMKGTFMWPSLPETLQVPRETGLVALTLNGHLVELPRRESNGQLWIATPAGEAANSHEENHLDIQVHRHLEDTIPVNLSTELSLNVSGQNREVLLEKVLLEGFIPTELTCGIPCQLTKDGQLRLQLRQGEWTVTLNSRHHGPITELALNGSGAEWPTEEIWVFTAHPELRTVLVSGPASIDPKQTTLKEAWRSLPTYRMQSGDTMRLTEQKRGDLNPHANQFRLSRNIWLDFDGSGYTMEDTLTGKTRESERLELSPLFEFGRASLNGTGQLITKRGEQAGIQLNPGPFTLKADIRIPHSASTLPTTGWNRDFQSLSTVLHLPPGFRLIAATGVDQAPQAWLNQWTLLDLFLVFIVSFAVSQLFGLKWGVLSLAGAALSFLDFDAPKLVWLAVLAGIALIRVLPKGRLHKAIAFYQIAAYVVLLTILLPFMQQQIRQTLYPSLEYTDQMALSDFSDTPSDGWGKDETMPSAAPMELDDSVRDRKESPRSSFKTYPEGSLAKSSPYTAQQQAILSEQSPTANVQTGPGLPRWTWNQVMLSWNGPVRSDQTLHLFLLPPLATRLLTSLKLILIALLAARLIPIRREAFRSMIKKTAIPLIGLFLPLLFTPPSSASEIPSTELLTTLKERLLEPPLCFPNCADISRMHLEATALSLRLQFTVSVQKASAIPLPGDPEEWLPHTVLLDGHPAQSLRLSDDGEIWMGLEAGVHELVLQGPLPRHENITLSIPLSPHYTTANLSAWTLEGLHEDGQIDSTIKLIRIETANSAEDGLTQSNALPPFVELKRQLLLGLKWEIENTLTRLTPEGTASVIKIPLLPGESITTDGIRVEDGKALITLPPQASELTWHSTLEISHAIQLHAESTDEWVEVWEVTASPIWYLESNGIPLTYSEGKAPTWRPWPGESVSIAITRPESLSGQTLTIDASDLTVTPGLRATDATLQLSLRSSLGGSHAITLPPHVQIHSLQINGQDSPPNLDGQKLILPIVPGKQEISLTWQQEDGIRTYFKTPEIDLGIPSVNTTLHLNLPMDRWALFFGGPRMGPAILFWSYLLLIAAAAIALGKLRLAPLSPFQWALLGLGLTVLPALALLVMVGWFLVFRWRKESPLEDRRRLFNLRQLVLVLWTIGFLSLLCTSIYTGLLGTPDMQIAGNGSSSDILNWFQDRSASILPRGWMLSVPLLVYRLLMLAWALWISKSLLTWLKWGWACFSETGYWRAAKAEK